MPEDTARRLAEIRVAVDLASERRNSMIQAEVAAELLDIIDALRRTGARPIRKDTAPSSSHQLIEDGRLIADWLGRAVNGPGSHHPFANYRLPGPIEQAMKRLTGSHDEQIGDDDA